MDTTEAEKPKAARSRQISDVVTGWLKRYSPAKKISHDQSLVQAEAEAIFRAFLKFAPPEGADRWCELAVRELDLVMTTRAWLPAGEVAKVLERFRSSSSMPSDFKTVEPTELEKFALSMNRGYPVGARIIWGIIAAQLETAGLVSEAIFTKYRSSLFFSDRDAYGATEALRRETERKAEHENAMASCLAEMAGDAA